MVKLTKTGIAKLTLKAQPAIHWDDELGGFGLRIYPSGAAAYVVDYRLKGSRKKRRVVLGKVAELTPQMARERAKAIKSAARNGVDLDQETRAQVAQRELEERRKGDAMTVVEAVAAYLEAFELETSKRSGRRPTASSVRATGVQLHRLLAIHGDKALEELTMRDVQAVLEATPQSSRRNVFGAIARLFAWARRQGIVTASPLERIDSPAAPASRDRTPSPSEVRSILKATDNLLASGKLHQAQRDGIWLCALTAQRRGEVATMTWEDVDFEAA
jgi:integrase